MIRVGIIIPEELSPEKNKKTSWLGGLNYYRNVISAVSKLPGREIEMVVFVNSDASETFIKQFGDVEIVKSIIVDFSCDPDFKFKKPLLKFFFYLLSKLKGTSYLIENLLLKNSIDVFAYGNPLHSKTIKSLAWVADFQQLHHPEFFSSPEEVTARNNHLNQLIKYSDCLILSSETALNDLKFFKKEFVSKARVLKFIPEINLNTRIISLDELRNKYSFRGDFFYLPNQFWKHKNHKIVISALDISIRKFNKNILVLASGSLNDYRNQVHIDEIVENIKSLHLEDSFRLLGVIPYIDVLSLMHFSIALINPSFSEGWSSTVEEAKQLAVPLVLSDIPIHREQTKNSTNTIYFDPQKADVLANILSNFSNKRESGKNFKVAADFEEKQLNFSAEFQSIVLEVVKNKSL